MAKAKVKNLDEAINSIFKKYASNLKRAMEYAANKAEDEINFKAKSCLYKYYDNYGPDHGEPNWYARTDSLRLAFVPVNEVVKNEDGIAARVGVIYDPSKLDGVYYSEASNKDFFNPVDSTWILKNYLAGIHPRTNGYPIYSDELVYNPKTDTVSPDETMKEYIQNYKDTFDKDVLWWLANRVTGR
jgi:hypothetical protein